MAKKKKLIPFIEAVRKKLIPDGSKVDWSACYPEDEGIIILSPEYTGWKDTQVFNRNEEKITWIFHKGHIDREDAGTVYNFKDKKTTYIFRNNQEVIPTLYGSPTEFGLTLNGKKGYDNGIAILNKIAGSWSNSKLNIQARSADMADCINLDVYTTVEWEANCFEHEKNNGSYVYGIKYILAGKFGCECILYEEYDDGGFDSNFDFNYSVRPVVPITESDILVDLNSYGVDGVWKLYPPKN